MIRCYFMQIHVNNKLATLKKVSSCEYVSENQLMHERGLSSSWEWKSPVLWATSPVNIIT